MFFVSCQLVRKTRHTIQNPSLLSHCKKWHYIFSHSLMFCPHKNKWIKYRNQPVSWDISTCCSVSLPSYWDFSCTKRQSVSLFVTCFNKTDCFFIFAEELQTCISFPTAPECNSSSTRLCCWSRNQPSDKLNTPQTQDKETNWWKTAKPLLLNQVTKTLQTSI